MGKMNAEIDAEFELSYDLNGIDLIVVSRAKVKAVIGTKEDYKDITGYEKLAKIDVAGLLDDSLTGAISIIPVGIEFPKTGLFEIARVKISVLKEKGICLSALEDVAPDAQKPDVKNVGDIMVRTTAVVAFLLCCDSSASDKFCFFGFDSFFLFFSLSLSLFISRSKKFLVLSEATYAQNHQASR